MLRFLFKLAFGLWLVGFVIMAGLTAWVMTTPEEKAKAQLTRLLTLPMLGPTEFKPLPPIETMRAETTTVLAEIDELYDELVKVLQAIQAAHTDKWEKRWAGDEVTIAEFDKRHFMKNIKYDRESDEPRRVASAWRAAVGRKRSVEGKLVSARERLQTVRAATPASTE